eukprot:3641065-Rhodomonas_salina.2
MAYREQHSLRVQTTQAPRPDTLGPQPLHGTPPGALGQYRTSRSQRVASYRARLLEGEPGSGRGGVSMRRYIVIASVGRGCATPQRVLPHPSRRRSASTPGCKGMRRRCARWGRRKRGRGGGGGEREGM